VLLDIGLTLAAGYLLGDPGGLDNAELQAISGQLSQISSQLDQIDRKLDMIIEQLKDLQIAMDKNKVETYMSIAQSRIGTLKGYMKDTSTFIPSEVLSSAATLMDSIYVLVGDSSNQAFSALLQTAAAYATWVQSYMAVVRQINGKITVWDHPHHQFYSNFTLQTVKDMTANRDQWLIKSQELEQWTKINTVFEFNGSFANSTVPFKMQYAPNEGRRYLYANVQFTYTHPPHPPVTWIKFCATDQNALGAWEWTPLFGPYGDDHWKAAWAANEANLNTLSQLWRALQQLAGIDALNDKLKNDVFKKPANWDSPPQPAKRSKRK